jgi:hypothetical protein
MCDPIESRHSTSLQKMTIFDSQTDPPVPKHIGCDILNAMASECPIVA